jgi:hypothetical protein
MHWFDHRCATVASSSSHVWNVMVIWSRITWCREMKNRKGRRRNWSWPGLDWSTNPGFKRRKYEEVKKCKLCATIFALSVPPIYVSRERLRLTENNSVHEACFVFICKFSSRYFCSHSHLANYNRDARRNVCMFSCRLIVIAVHF